MKLFDLAPRELQLLQLLVDGESARSASLIMGLREGYIYKLQERIKFKWRSSNMFRCVAIAARKKLISIK